MSTASPRRAPGRARGRRRALGASAGASLPGNAVVGVPTGFWKEQDLSKSIYSQAGGTKPSQPLQAASVCHRTFPMGIRTWSVHPLQPPGQLPLPASSQHGSGFRGRGSSTLSSLPGLRAEWGSQACPSPVGLTVCLCLLLL